MYVQLFFKGGLWILGDRFCDCEQCHKHVPSQKSLRSSLYRHFCGEECLSGWISKHHQSAQTGTLTIPDERESEFLNSGITWAGGVTLQSGKVLQEAELRPTLTLAELCLPHAQGAQ